MAKIIRLHAFGGPENLQIDELPSQQLKESEVRRGATTKENTANLCTDCHKQVHKSGQ